MKKILLFFVFTLITAQAFSQWSTDPLVNNLVTNAGSNQFYIETCPDGAGGIIMIWTDFRSGNAELFAQKINAFGQTIWTANGQKIQTNSTQLWTAKICPDAAGGCIITWVESNGPNIVYAQRIRTDGVVMWTSGGIKVSRASDYSSINDLKIIPAEAGSSIIAWLTFQDFSTPGLLYTQKVDPFGNRLWAVNDVQLSYFDTHSFDLCKDGLKGAYYSFSMFKSFPAGAYNVYGQHVDAGGNILWPIETVVCNFANDQLSPQMCEDQNRGFIVAWQDYRTGVRYDIYASHFDESHNELWAANGTPISTFASDKFSMLCISDNNSGAHIAWVDNRPLPFSGLNIFAQNINYNGVTRWTSNGKMIASRVDFAFDTYTPKITTVDALGGLIACWIGYADDAYTQYGLLAQRVDYYGNNLWDNNGVFVSKGFDKRSPSIIFDGGSSGCNIAWVDARNNGVSGQDIYSQHVKANSNLGNQINNGPPTANSVAQNFPNPFNPETKISFNISEPGLVTLKIFDISGREVASLVNGFYNIGDYSVNWNAGKFSSGAYFYKFTSNSKSEIKKMMLIK